MPDATIQELLKTNAKYKLRSHQTHYETHKPELDQLIKSVRHRWSSTDPDPKPTLTASPVKIIEAAPDVAPEILLRGEPAAPKTWANLFKKTAVPAVLNDGATIKHPPHEPDRSLVSPPPSINPRPIILIGDSMLERFKTTGLLIKSKISSRPETFNAGVGGDKIENVIYRLDLGLLQLLQPLLPLLWVVHIGTNNLRGKKKPLRPFELDNYALLLRALLSVSPLDAKVLAVGIFRRKDIDDASVRTSNEAIKAVVDKMNGALGSERVRFVEQPDQLSNAHLVDHVHLDVEGYGIWDRVLRTKMEEILKGTCEV